MYDNNPITFLNLHRLPARIDYQGAGVLLHFEPGAIRALVELPISAQQTDELHLPRMSGN
jgi:hypothetical protein